MKFPSIVDSRGNPSQTLFWVSIALIAVIGRFVAGVFPGIDAMDPISFATAFTTLLAPWVAREGIEKLVANRSEFKLPSGA